MGDLLMIFIGVGIVLLCLGEGIVRIIKAANAGGSAKHLAGMREQLAEMEDELLDARKRIEVLESIVTDDRHQLRKQIDELGA